MSERTGRSPIVIENIGPIEKLVLEVPDAGIVVLQGKNGVGKSHALSAISAAFEGKGKLSRRDNADRGLVKAFGAVISVQKSTRYAGRLEVETVVGRYDLATAVNPGIEDPVAADRARIKSLLSIAGITISKRQFLPITHDDTLQQSLMDLHIDEELFGPAEMADIIKKHLESEARVREKKAERLRYRIAALQNKLPDKMEPIDYQEARKEYEDAVAECKVAQQVFAHSMSQIALFKKLKSQIAYLEGQLKVDNEKELEEEATSLYNQIKAKRKDIEDLRIELARLEQRHLEVTAQLKNVRNIKAKIEGLRAELPQDLQEFNVEVVTVAQAKVEKSQRKIQLAEKYQEYKAVQEEIKSLEAELEKEQKTAAEARLAISRINDVLAKAMSQVSPNFAVEDRRLKIKTDRGMEFFADLSFGEQWRAVLEIVTKQMGPNGVLVVPQEAWEGIDPINRKELARLAVEYKVVIITAEATDADSIQAMVIN